MTPDEVALVRAVGIDVVEKEWEYFQEWARRFDDYPADKRYGILPWGAKPAEENMIYAEDTKELRRKHLMYLRDNPLAGDVGYQLRKHIDWIEKMEGKQ